MRWHASHMSDYYRGPSDADTFDNQRRFAANMLAFMAPSRDTPYHRHSNTSLDLSHLLTCESLGATLGVSAQTILKVWKFVESLNPLKTVFKELSQLTMVKKWIQATSAVFLSILAQDSDIESVRHVILLLRYGDEKLINQSHLDSLLYNLHHHIQLDAITFESSGQAFIALNELKTAIARDRAMNE
jgi:hypothetical protein